MRDVLRLQSASSRVLRGLALALIAVLLLPMEPAEARVKTLYTFCPNFDCSAGAGPRGSLLVSPKGSLYGVAYYGGANGQGVAYVLQHQKPDWIYQPIYHFCALKNCADGATPSTPLIADVDGNLYGAAQGGGQNGGGVFFELSPSAQGQTEWTEKVLYNFCAAAACADGSQPLYRLTYAGAAAGAPYDGSSPIYGVTIDGPNDKGVIYNLALRKNGWTERVLYTFCSRANCVDGEGPTGGPVLDPAGNVYGVTYYGGRSNYGVLYRLSGSHYHVLHHFCAACSDGGDPVGTLAIDAAGALYGTAKYGGVCSGECGTLFRFDPGASQYTVLYSFCQLNHCRDGNEPSGDVTLDDAGNLYGTTSRDGHDCDGYPGLGTVYKLSGSVLTLLYTSCVGPPAPGLTFGKSGALVGATMPLGSSQGTIFQLSP